MKLELKHLAAYLPYGVKLSKIHVLNIGNGIGSLSHILTTKNDQYKMILRPLSDLFKEIECNGEKLIPIERLRSEFLNIYFEIGILNSLVIKGKNENFIIYSSTILINEKLCEWHFDIFGLIDAGLSVDINTVKF